MMFFFRLIPVLLLAIIIFLYRMRYLLVSYVLGFFSISRFQSSTFHAYFANELEGEAKGRIHAQIIVICYLLLIAKK